MAKFGEFTAFAKQFVTMINRCRDGHVKPAAQIRFFEATFQITILMAVAERGRDYDEISTSDLEAVHEQALRKLLAEMPTA